MALRARASFARLDKLKACPTSAGHTPPVPAATKGDEAQRAMFLERAVRV
jgi:hypothetical protein